MSGTGVIRWGGRNGVKLTLKDFGEGVESGFRELCERNASNDRRECGASWLVLFKVGERADESLKNLNTELETKEVIDNSEWEKTLENIKKLFDGVGVAKKK